MLTHLRMPCAVLAFFALPATSIAGDDAVTANGNRMTGEIRKLSRGALEVSIDGIRGTSTIAWSDVETIESPQRFELMLESGEKVAGVITSLSNGVVELRGDAGPRTFAQQDVIILHVVGASFVDRLTGSLDFGTEFLTAGDTLDWTLNAEATHRTRYYVTEAAVSSLMRRSGGTTSQRRNHIHLASRRLLERRWFALGTVQAEEDKELGLESRALLGAAFGRTLVKTQRTVFAMYGGVDVSREDYRDVDPDSVPELLGAIEWDWFEIGGELELLMNATTYVAPEDSRVRVEFEGHLRHDVFQDYYVSLNLFESYNSDPPEGLEKSDLGVSISFGRTF